MPVESEYSAYYLTVIKGLPYVSIYEKFNVKKFHDRYLLRNRIGDCEM